jgi:type III secretory pathway component EscS
MVFLITFINDIYTSIHFNQPNQHLQARLPTTFKATS